MTEIKSVLISDLFIIPTSCLYLYTSEFCNAISSNKYYCVLLFTLSIKLFFSYCKDNYIFWLRIVFIQKCCTDGTLHEQQCELGYLFSLQYDFFCFVVFIMLAQLYSKPILNQIAFVSKIKIGRGKFSCVCVKTET